MNKKVAGQFRRERASEIKKLADLLRRKSILQNTEPLTTAADFCSNTPQFLEEFRDAKIRGNKEFWEYRISDLRFTSVDKECLGKSIPKQKELKDLQIALSVYLYGICLDDNPSVVTNPFVALSVEIAVFANDRNDNEVKCSWHLDKNIVSKNDNNSKFAHPDYHFQHGGFQISNIQNYGNNLLSEVPRLAHPPLDGILAIDFILSNYFGSKWLNLRNDSEYQKLIRAAQERCWAAYAFSTAMEWKSNINWQNQGFFCDWNVNVIWPQLINKQY